MQTREQISAASLAYFATQGQPLWTSHSGAGFTGVLDLKASGPDKLPLVELCNSKIIDQDFFWVLEMVFSDSVPKGFIILLA